MHALSEAKGLTIMKNRRILPLVSLLVAVAALFALGALAGCAAPAQDAGETDAQQPAESAQAAPEPEPEPQSFEVTLGFTGDICLADNYIPMQHLADLHSTDITDGIDRRFVSRMNKMDLLWVNNEFVFSDRGEALDGKMWTFRGATKNVSHLHDLGVDIAGLANNHVFDYGEDAFLDTLDTLTDAGIPYVGAGRDFAEASAPVYLEANGVKVAYVAASRAEYTVYTPEATDDSPGIMWCYDDALFLDEIREAAANADFVVALPHWGVEHSTELEEGQIASARDYIDAGADAVIGAHTHILQGIDFYEGKPIMYSLGNFWFDGYDIDTLLAELRISGGLTADGKPDLDNAKVELVLYPGTQSGVFTSYAATENERSRIFRYIEGISDNQVEIAKDGVVRAAA